MATKQRKTYLRAKKAKGPKGTKHLEKLHVKKGDLVEIISGSNKGKRGVIKTAFPGKGMVEVEGINQKWKHLRRSQENPQGGRLQREYPIPACKVKKVEG